MEPRSLTEEWVNANNAIVPIVRAKFKKITVVNQVLRHFYFWLASLSFTISCNIDRRGRRVYVAEEFFRNDEAIATGRQLGKSDSVEGVINQVYCAAVPNIISSPPAPAHATDSAPS